MRVINDKRAAATGCVPTGGDLPANACTDPNDRLRCFQIRTGTGVCIPTCNVDYTQGTVCETQTGGGVNHSRHTYGHTTSPSLPTFCRCRTRADLGLGRQVLRTWHHRCSPQKSHLGLCLKLCHTDFSNPEHSSSNNVMVPSTEEVTEYVSILDNLRVCSHLPQNS